ncbi:MAG: helix-turn-helix domain-containing protein [Candidatus Zixiibacteriota bacterium]|nr:MAG: helix-turn-helix domain-containing protein [candidate division Zixibacteria bacterium]
MELKVLKTRDEYLAALDRLKDLMDQNPSPETPAFDELEVLALILKDYEKKHCFIAKPSPVEAIKFRMEQMGLSRKDLVPYFGSPSRISEVFSGKRKLSKRMIREIHEALDIPLDTLVGESQSVKDESSIDWEKLPLKELNLRGWIGKYKDKVSDLREYAEELTKPLIEQLNEHCVTPAYHRGSLASAHYKNKVDSHALLAWQAIVVSKAVNNPLYNKYLPVDRNFIELIVQQSIMNNGLNNAKELLNKRGIHLIIEKHFKNTYLDGAAMLLKEGTPIIGMTLRQNRLDNFWFTLVHELVHVMNDLNSDSGSFLDSFLGEKGNRSEVENTEIEIAADTISEDILIPTDAWERFRPQMAKASIEKIAGLAAQLRIHPSIIAGRIRYETANYGRYAKLLGNGIPQKCFMNDSNSAV